MGLIKASQPPPAAVPFSLADIEMQARAILLRARQQADQLLVAAQQEADLIKRDAHQRALAEGREEGLKKGREEGLKAGKDQALAENRTKLTQLVNSLTAAARQLDQQRLELATSAQEDVIGLALAIADRVARRRGQLDPQVAIANVTEALKIVTHASDIRIAVNPAHKAAMEEALPALKLQWPALAHVQVVDDPALAPGGARVFTQHGRIDADLDEQLRRIAQDLAPE